MRLDLETMTMDGVSKPALWHDTKEILFLLERLFSFAIHVDDRDMHG
jgi:hypothetical protein